MQPAVWPWSFTALPFNQKLSEWRRDVTGDSPVFEARLHACKFIRNERTPKDLLARRDRCLMRCFHLNAFLRSRIARVDHRRSQLKRLDCFVSLPDGRNCLARIFECGNAFEPVSPEAHEMLFHLRRGLLVASVNTMKMKVNARDVHHDDIDEGRTVLIRFAKCVDMRDLAPVDHGVPVDCGEMDASCIGKQHWFGV